MGLCTRHGPSLGTGMTKLQVKANTFQIKYAHECLGHCFVYHIDRSMTSFVHRRRKLCVKTLGRKLPDASAGRSAPTFRQQCVRLRVVMWLCGEDEMMCTPICVLSRVQTQRLSAGLSCPPAGMQQQKKQQSAPHQTQMAKAYACLTARNWSLRRRKSASERELEASRAMPIAFTPSEPSAGSGNPHVGVSGTPQPHRPGLDLLGSSGQRSALGAAGARSSTLVGPPVVSAGQLAVPQQPLPLHMMPRSHVGLFSKEL